MPDLIAGPILRCPDTDEVSVWVQTDAPCEVEVLGERERTFCVAGRHFALVAVRGLPPGRDTPYTVRLDGAQVWPPPGGDPGQAIIRPPADDRLRVAFGSCRVTAPHEPPHVLQRHEADEGRGIDALRTLALRAEAEPDGRPDLLLMLGDQLYADDPAAAVAREVGSSGDGDHDPPQGHLEDFSDYAFAYVHAWTHDAPLRRLLATVPSLMIFDDHEIVDEWQLSQAWLEDMRACEWYDRRVTGGLAAYWLYQHLGNLSAAERDSDELLARVRAAEDGWPELQAFARDADMMVERSRWSYARRIGPARLVVLDTRAGRRLEPGRRRILREEEFAWIDERLTGGDGHLLLASSLPVFLTPALHDLEVLSERMCDGRLGARAMALGERMRRFLHLGHWAAFDRSFRDLCASLGEVAAGRRGAPPASLLVLSGDVHHSYLARIGLPGSCWQLVSSPFRKELRRRERLLMRFGASRAGDALGRALRRAGGAPPPPIRWQLRGRPNYDNGVAILELDGGAATVRFETVAGADWRDPRLHTVLERSLT